MPPRTRTYRRDRRAPELHGGLTLDYLHEGGIPQVHRVPTRAPSSQATQPQSGVDLPMLTIALSTGGPLPTQPLISEPRAAHPQRPRAHARQRRTQRSQTTALATLSLALAGKGPTANSLEVLTPLRGDPPAALPLLDRQQPRSFGTPTPWPHSPPTGRRLLRHARCRSRSPRNVGQRSPIGHQHKRAQPEARSAPRSSVRSRPPWRPWFPRWPGRISQC